MPIQQLQRSVIFNGCIISIKELPHERKDRFIFEIKNGRVSDHVSREHDRHPTPGFPEPIWPLTNCQSISVSTFGSSAGAKIMLATR